MTNPKRIVVLREPWSDFYVLAYDGKTEELEFEETRAWFKAHGADMIKLEPALDEVQNFQQTIVNIADFKEPVQKFPGFEPQV